MELQTTCPWCETDIIWDKEIGPEKYCPHCDNEISGYRTLELDSVFDEEDELEHDHTHTHDDMDWDEDDDKGILRSTREIAANSVIQNLLNEQYEMPECTNCREYMIEVGTQNIQHLEPKVQPQSGQPLVNESMRVIWYVCPSCHRTDSYLSLQDRKQLLDSLTPQE